MDKQKGFTLIELITVIAIIGLLASVVILAINSAKKKTPLQEKEECLRVGKYSSVKDLPAVCLKYFNGESKKTY